MKTLTFYKEGILQLGIKVEGGVVDVNGMITKYIPSNEFGDYPRSTKELIHGGLKAKNQLNKLVAMASKEDILIEENLELGPSVPNPQKIVCVGLNYRKHAEETNLAIPEYPVLFSKFNNTLTGHLNPIKLPRNSMNIDYEGELVLVIGREAKYITNENAREYIYGYTIANDLSARDLQVRSSQWLLGKSYDDFCPIGPYLISSEEIRNPNELFIRTIVNGKIRQNSTTSDMIFNCEEIVSYVSQYMTLYPGDIILTGTPEGVILGYNEADRIWIKENDIITIEIEKIGSLTNAIV